jgi:hypothetical protein
MPVTWPLQEQSWRIREPRPHQKYLIQRNHLLRRSTPLPKWQPVSAFKLACPSAEYRSTPLSVHSAIPEAPISWNTICENKKSSIFAFTAVTPHLNFWKQSVSCPRIHTCADAI